MTVSTTTIKNSAAGNGSTTAFSFTFKAFASSEVKVYVRTDSTGAEALKAEGTGSANYAVSGVGAASGGTVTFVTAPASGETVVIRRLTSQTQGTDYVENDPFSAEDHETALDKLTHIVQEVQEEVDRSFKVSKTNSITTPEFVDDASTRASKLLGFSSDGNNLEATTGRVSSVTTSNVAVDGSGASQSATVSFNSTSGALALGIPVGATGATGAAGSADGTLTTRGDIVVRNATEAVRLGIGAANRVLISDGTDLAYGQVPLATAVSGQLPLANGGTGATSLAGANIMASDTATRVTANMGFTPVTDASSSNSVTFDFSAGNISKITLSENITSVTLAGAAAGDILHIQITQDSTARTISGWPAAVKWSGGGTAPTISTTSGAVDIVSMLYDGTNYWASVTQDHR